MRKGFDAEVSFREELIKNKCGDFQVIKSTHYKIVKSIDYGKEDGVYTNSEYLYEITSYEYIGMNTKRTKEHEPAIPRENTNY